MSSVFFFQGLIVEKSIQYSYSEAFKKLKAGLYNEVRFEKKTTAPGSPDIYSIRIKGMERGTRLLFTPIQYEGENSLLFLEKINKHRYQDSRFLNNPQLLRHYIQKFYGDEIHLITSELEAETSSNKSIFLDRMPEAIGGALEKITDIRPGRSLGFWFKKALIRPDEYQASAATFSVPKIIKGTAGSGKSLVLLNLLEQAIYCCDEGARIVCLTSSYSVLDEWKRNWQELDASRSGHVEFKTVLEWIHEMNPTLASRSTIVGVAEFSLWYQGKNKPNSHRLLSSANLVYQEMRICSGYSRAEYLSLDSNASLIPTSHQEVRKTIIQLLTDWKGMVMSHADWIDPSFVSFPIKTHCDLLFIDEAPDLSQGLMRLLLRYCQKEASTLPHFIFAGDEMQRLHDAKPVFTYIKQQLFDMISKTPKYSTQAKQLMQNLFVELPVTYRLFHGIEGAVNQILDCHQRMLGRSSKKQYTGTMIFDKGPVSRPGRVDWFSQGTLSLIEEIKTLIARYPNIVIITLPGYIQAAKELFASNHVMSIEDFKGMERDVVVLWRCFEDPELIKASRVLKDLETKSALPRPSSSSKKSAQLVKTQDLSYPELLPPISRLYTQFTRGLKRLIIINSPSPHDHQLAWLYQRLQSTLIKHESWRSLEEDLHLIDINQAWLDYIILLIRNEQIACARQLFHEHLANQREQCFDELLSNYGPRTMRESLALRNLVGPASSAKSGQSAEDKQKQSINDRIRHLFVVNKSIIGNIIISGELATKNLHLILTTPVSLISSLTYEHLTMQFEGSNQLGRTSILVWLFNINSEGRQFLLQILDSNPQVLNALQEQIRLYLQPEQNSNQHKNLSLYFMGFPISDEYENKIMARLLEGVNEDLFEVKKKLFLDISQSEKELFALYLNNSILRNDARVLTHDNSLNMIRGFNYISLIINFIKDTWIRLLPSQPDLYSSFKSLLEEFLSDENKNYFNELEREKLLLVYEALMADEPNMEVFFPLFAKISNELQDYPFTLLRFMHSRCTEISIRVMEIPAKLNQKPDYLWIRYESELLFYNNARFVRNTFHFMKKNNIDAKSWLNELLHSSGYTGDELIQKEPQLYILILWTSINALEGELSQDVLELKNYLAPYNTPGAATTGLKILLLDLYKMINQTIYNSSPYAVFTSRLRVIRDRLQNRLMASQALNNWAKEERPIWIPAKVNHKSGSSSGQRFFQSKSKARQSVFDKALSLSVSDTELENAYRQTVVSHLSPRVFQDARLYFGINAEFNISFISNLIAEDNGFKDYGFNQVASLFTMIPELVEALTPADIFHQMTPKTSNSDNSFFSWLCELAKVRNHQLLKMILEKNKLIYATLLRFFIKAYDNVAGLAAKPASIDMIHFLLLRATPVGIEIINRVLGDLDFIYTNYEALILANQPKCCLEYLIRLRNTPEKEWETVVDKLKLPNEYPHRIQGLFKLMKDSNNAGRKLFNSFQAYASLQDQITACFKWIVRNGSEKNEFNGLTMYATTFNSLSDKSLPSILNWATTQLRSPGTGIITVEDGLLRVICDRIHEQMNQELEAHAVGRSSGFSSNSAN